MPLAVISVDTDYELEKGQIIYAVQPLFIILTSFPVKISDFLSQFKSSEKDLSTTFSEFTLDDEEPREESERLTLKYMKQLVRDI